MTKKYKIKKSFNAAFLIKKNVYEIRKVNTPLLDQSKIVINIKVCSICGSDLKIFENGTKRFNLPQITGHEISGVVIYVGNQIKGFRVGDKVSIGADLDNNINLAIGHELPGGFSEYMIFEKKTLKNIPIQKFKNMNFKTASLAEPLACCLNGFEISNVKKNSDILIIGGGPIGLILSKLSYLYQARNIILIEKSGIKVKLIKKLTSHIDYILDGNKEKNIKIINQITQNKGVDYIFTANSDQNTHIESFEYISNNGTINLFGGIPNNTKIKIPVNDIHYKQLKLVGSHGSKYEHHKNAVKILDSKQLKLDFLFTHNFSLKDISKAFQCAKKNNSLKVTVN